MQPSECGSEKRMSDMETETGTQIGALLPGIANHGREPMASPMPSTMPWPDLDLDQLPARLDKRLMTMVREIRDSALPAPASSDEVWFAQCMKAMDILPRRQDDQLGGKMRFSLYKRHLEGYSNEALSYLAEKATAGCHFYPSIAECLDILKAWPNRNRDAERQEKAGHLYQRELNARMDEALGKMAERSLPQSEVDTLPEYWKRIAVEKGYLRKLRDGSYHVWPDTMGMAEEELTAHRERVAKLREEGLL